MLGGSYECSHCQSKYLHRRADRLVRCEECETIVEESLTQPIPYTHHKETTELLQMVTPMHLTVPQRTDLANKGLPSGFVAVYSVVQTDPYTLFLGMPSSIPADLLDLQRRFSSLSTHESSNNASASSKLATTQPPVASTSPASQSSQPATQLPTPPSSQLVVAPSPVKAAQPKGNVLYKNLLLGFYMIQRIAKEFQVKHQILDDAFTMFRIALELVPTKKIEEMAAGAMRLAMDRHNDVKPFPNFCAATGKLTAPQVHDGAKSVRKAVPPHLLEKAGALSASDQTRMISQIDLLTKELKLSQETKEMAILFVQRVVDASLTTRKHPRSVPAACIYLACEWTQERRSQGDVSRAASIAEGTIRTITHELRTKLLQYAKNITESASSSSAVTGATLSASGDAVVPGSAAKSSSEAPLSMRSSMVITRPANGPQQSIRSFFSPIHPAAPPAQTHSLLDPSASASSSSSSLSRTSSSSLPVNRTLFPEDSVQNDIWSKMAPISTLLGPIQPDDADDIIPLTGTQESDNAERPKRKDFDQGGADSQPKRRKMNDDDDDE